MSLNIDVERIGRDFWVCDVVGGLEGFRFLDS